MVSHFFIDNKVWDIAGSIHGSVKQIAKIVFAASRITHSSKL